VSAGRIDVGTLRGPGAAGAVVSGTFDLDSESARGDDSTYRRYTDGATDPTTVHAAVADDGRTLGVGVAGPRLDAARAFLRDEGLDDAPALAPTLAVVDDADDPLAFRAPARESYADGRDGTVVAGTDGPTVAAAGVRADGTVPTVEFRAGTDGAAVQRTAGLSLGRWRDPVEAGRDRAARLPDPPVALAARAPDEGQSLATRAHVYVHRVTPHDRAPDDPDRGRRDDLLVVGPFPERNVPEFERADTVTWARWPPGEELPAVAPAVDAVHEFAGETPAAAAEGAGRALREAMGGRLTVAFDVPEADLDRLDGHDPGARE
jgi:hypothetical protein